MKVYIIFLFYVIVFGGCSSLVLKEKSSTRRPLSCEEKAKPKSLLYLEQQYRCTTQIEEK